MKRFVLASTLALVLSLAAAGCGSSDDDGSKPTNINTVSTVVKIGTIFDTVIKEGVVLQKGNDGNYGAQAVDLSPAQGAIIEFNMPEDGLYPMVTHAFNFVGRGALGLLKAGDGDPLK